MLSMVLLWSSTIVLVLFSLLGLLSIGLFYFPAALALMAAALFGSIGVAGSRGPDTATEA
ncbi:MAG: hypothetical protein J4N64_02915, partial [Chloroflexi bacterium]|nr:hypothetical protein [Chloroflexota bacterium]